MSKRESECKRERVRVKEKGIREGERERELVAQMRKQKRHE